MRDANEYTMLIASLPHPGSLFTSTRAPINRVKLEARLRMLKPEHRETLELIVKALLWFALPLGMEERAIFARNADAMTRIENETLRQIILDRLEIRTCVAALRHRQAGHSSPPPDRYWGYGRWLSHISRNWAEPSFRLDGVFPWLREANRLLRDGDTLRFERLLLEAAWKSLGRVASEHEFDFEAVVIYVLRWNLIARWTLYNGTAASKRFSELVDSAIGKNELVFQGGRN